MITPLKKTTEPQYIVSATVLCFSEELVFVLTILDYIFYCIHAFFKKKAIMLFFSVERTHQKNCEY